MKIMIVDDSERMRLLIRQTLQPFASEFVECGDGLEAVAAFDRHHPDWVIMDVEMPSMDGIAATRQLKATFPEAHVVILTAFDSPAIRKAASQAGVSEYFLKDDLSLLQSAVSRDSDAGPDQTANQNLR